MKLLRKIVLLLFALHALASCQRDQDDFFETHRESIEKTLAYIQDFKVKNGSFPTSRECRDWISRACMNENAGITVLNVRFDKESQKPLAFDIFDGEDWICIYNLNSKKVEKKIPFSSYTFSSD